MNESKNDIAFLRAADRRNAFRSSRSTRCAMADAIACSLNVCAMIPHVLHLHSAPHTRERAREKKNERIFIIYI